MNQFKFFSSFIFFIGFMLFVQVDGKAQCPMWNDCFTVTSDGCNHTIVIDITGDVPFTNTEISALNLNFGITSGSGTIKMHHL